jgi:putative ABC transport system permease protein
VLGQSLRTFKRRPQLFIGPFVALTLGVAFMTVFADTSLSAARASGGFEVPFDSPTGGSGLHLAAISMIGITEIAAFVTAFTVASTTAFAVGLRRADIALLRLVGATPRQVRRMIVREIAVMTLLAVIAGGALAVPGDAGVAKILVHEGIAPANFHIEYSLLGSGFVLFNAPLRIVLLLGLSILSSLPSAVRASSVRPSEAMRSAVNETTLMTRPRWAIGGMSLILLSVYLPKVPDMVTHGGISLPPPVIVLGLLLLAFAALLPVFVRQFARLVSWPAVRVTAAAGVVAHAGFRTSLHRTTSAVCSVMLGLGLVIGLPIGFSTPRDTAANEHLRTLYLIFYALIAIVYAGIVIVSTLAMSISMQKDEINLLRKMGALPRQIIAVHLIEAAVIVVSGAVLALLASFGAFLTAHWVFSTAHATGTFAIPWRSSSEIAVGDVLLTLVASYMPVALILRKSYRVLGPSSEQAR